MYLLLSDLLDTFPVSKMVHNPFMVSHGKAASPYKNPPTAGPSHDASGLKDTTKETPVYSARIVI